ncbi:hypothetical protein N7472_002154 [Penicillium cf. griseofulvum]|uniref:Uncharacterized protein n=1 Tax=Penicillium cf. griseofulvum TaxID=2972120 RepID=A0A9W9MQM0_9EURO|nr:hypothetical protein N7472_002154 [Penicillium cf. griseofulvum]KAJ5449311.1 hypothetical protein N7445_004132 [Penicillium cf. griseofulvum]
MPDNEESDQQAEKRVDDLAGIFKQIHDDLHGYSLHCLSITEDTGGLVLVLVPYSTARSVGIRRFCVWYLCVVSG